MIKDFIETGKIVAAHGIKGEVRIQPWTSSMDDLISYKRLYFDEGAALIEFKYLRVHNSVLVGLIEGVQTRDEARAFVGKKIFVARKDLGLKEGEHLIQDIVGMKVYDADTQALYGTVTDVSQPGANDVYHVRFKDGKERLVPAIKSVVLKIDAKNDRIEIRPLVGLFDDED